MWPGFIEAIWNAVKAALAVDGSFNTTIVGGAVGGSTVKQGDPNAGGADAWPTADAAVLAKLSSDPATQTTLAAVLAKIVTAPALEGGNLATLVTLMTALQQPTKLTAVTPSDSTDLTTTATKGIWIGGAGDLSVKLTGDSGATSILAVPAGRFLPGSFARVMAATTATSIVAFS